jgi:hypothetical protein
MAATQFTFPENVDLVITWGTHLDFAIAALAKAAGIETRQIGNNDADCDLGDVEGRNVFFGGTYVVARIPDLGLESAFVLKHDDIDDKSSDYTSVLLCDVREQVSCETFKHLMVLKRDDDQEAIWRGFLHLQKNVDNDLSDALEAELTNPGDVEVYRSTGKIVCEVQMKQARELERYRGLDIEVAGVSIRAVHGPDVGVFPPAKACSQASASGTGLHIRNRYNPDQTKLTFYSSDWHQGEKILRLLRAAGCGSGSNKVAGATLRGHIHPALVGAHLAYLAKQ